MNFALCFSLAFALLVATARANVKVTATGDNRYDLWVNNQYVGGALSYGSDVEPVSSPLVGCGSAQTSNGCDNSYDGSGLVDLPNWGDWYKVDEVTVPLQMASQEFVVAFRGLQGFPDNSGDNPTSRHANSPVGVILHLVTEDGRQMVTNQHWFCSHTVAGVEDTWYTLDFDPEAAGWESPSVLADYGGGEWGTRVDQGSLFAGTSAQWIWTKGGNVHDQAYCRLHVPGDELITNCDMDVDCGCKQNVKVYSDTTTVTLSFDDSVKDTCSDTFPKNYPDCPEEDLLCVDETIASDAAAAEAATVDGTPVSFGDQPAGRYRVKYVTGCMKWGTGDSFTWTVHAIEDGAGFWISLGAQKSTDVQAPGSIGNRTPNFPNAGGFATDTECVEWNTENAVPVEFDHPGGEISIWLEDNHYPDNVVSSDGAPQYKLERLTDVCV